MNKKQIFNRHQNTERMPGTKLKQLNVTSFTIKLNKTIMFIYYCLNERGKKNHCS